MPRILWIVPKMKPAQSIRSTRQTLHVAEREQDMALARVVMRENHNALRDLAKKALSDSGASSKHAGIDEN